MVYLTIVKLIILKINYGSTTMKKLIKIKTNHN